MNAYFNFLNQLQLDVEKRYNSQQGALNWYHPYRSVHLEEKQRALIEKLKSSVKWYFQDTKPVLNQLSKGCRICGEGEWSCLFITGMCNARCFYCPTAQNTDAHPQTQKVVFENAEDYAAYIKEFDFKGVSFSGGEPLLYFDRTLHFLKTIREKCSPDIYIWVYTNGILADAKKLEALAKAGLDEIRFDIGAVDYKTRVLKDAAKFIPNVTVEIPAVPEHLSQLKKILPELVTLGVTNLNLHQLRYTQYNSSKLFAYNYSYLHGEHPVVAESEIAALEIMDYVQKEQLAIGVNYCAFQYKNRFQKAGYRNVLGRKLSQEGEELTRNGFYRLLTNGEGSALHLSDLLLNKYDLSSLSIAYKAKTISNLAPVLKRNVYKIGKLKYNIEDGYAMRPVVLSKEEIAAYINMIRNKGEIIPEDAKLFQLWRFEFVESGLREYF